MLAAALVLVGVLLTRSPEPTARDRYRVAEERIEAERARGRLDKADVERLRIALHVAREGTDGERYRLLRGETPVPRTRAGEPCRVVRLDPWLDEQLAVADCDVR